MAASTMLSVGQIVRYPDPPAPEPEHLDGYRNFFNLTAMPASRRLIMNRGIDHPAWVSAPEGRRRPVIFLRSNPLQAGSSKTPWHDEIDVVGGRVVYYGDHRPDTPAPLGSTRGNAILLQTAEAHTSDIADVRAAAPPLLIFRSTQRNQSSKGYLEFCGIGIIEHATIAELEDPGSHKHFSNYVFHISLLDLRPEGNRLDWRWINARRDPTSTLDTTTALAPDSWVNWVKGGAIKKSRVEPKMRSPDWVWDELVLACALVHRNNWHEVKHYDKRASELSELLQQLPFHPPTNRGSDFRNTNSVQRKTADIVTAHPDYTGATTRGGRATRQIVEAFLADPPRMLAAADRIAAAITSGDQNLREVIATPSPDEDEETALEGRSLERLHRFRERDRGLRKKRIDKTLAEGGDLACEVCGFNFTRAYGTHGDGYIEVHHLIPLHEAGESETKLSDLVLLCANCHRMSHRRLQTTGTWPSPDELRDLIK
ncbi:HNH endonuclease [Actinomadura sp. 3N508]|uniref:HNH endonuclease n=1 Tax=Actinomadura sp. 3N508 TaxID=3375153 RepID=UPI0037B907C2